MVLLYALAMAKEAQAFVTPEGDPWLEYECKVQSVQGHTLAIDLGQSDYPNNPAANAFYLWTIEFLDGELRGFSTVVTGSTLNTLSLSAAFRSADLAPAAGDTFRLSKGPLGKVRVYMTEPSTKDESDEKYYLTIAPVAKSSRFTTLNANSTANRVEASKIVNTMKFDMLGELPYGIPNDLGYAPEKRADTHMYLLAEQLEIFVHGFSSRGNNGILNVVAIDVEYLIRQPVGTRKPTQACALSFEFEVR